MIITTHVYWVKYSEVNKSNDIWYVSKHLDSGKAWNDIALELISLIIAVFILKLTEWIYRIS